MALYGGGLLGDYHIRRDDELPSDDIVRSPATLNEGRLWQESEDGRHPGEAMKGLLAPGLQQAQAQVGGSPAYPTSDFGSNRQLDIMYSSMRKKAEDEGWDTKWIDDWYRKELQKIVTPIMTPGGQR